MNLRLVIKRSHVNVTTFVATKSDAEAAYKENKQLNQCGKKIRPVQPAAKPLKKIKEKSKTEKGKASEKKKSQAQEQREVKEGIQKAQREQMKELLKERNEINCQLIDDESSDDDQVPSITPRDKSSLPQLTVIKETPPIVREEGCCQVINIRRAIIKNQASLFLLTNTSLYCVI